MKILIVEDDGFLRDIYENVFKSRGHEVTMAIDGTDGVAKIKEYRFDAIISDYSMPGYNGIQLSEYADNSIPVFLLSSDSKYVEEANGTPTIKAAFNKSINITDIASEIEGMMR